MIDIHTHAFPDNLAPKVIEKLSHKSGGLEPFTDGTVTGLKKSMKKNNIDISVVMNISTNPKQQAKVNDFAASINNGEDLFAFGSVHPDSPDVMDELERIKELGLLGVKFHPDYQDFFADDEKMKPIYKKVSSLGLIALFHAGYDFGFASPYGATPERLEKALSWFEGPVIAAHWGGLCCFEGVLERLCGRENLYIDTSFGYGTLPKYFAEKIIEKQGTDAILFGTDTPWHNKDMEMRLLDSLCLGETEMQNITHNNAKKLLKI